MYDKQLANVNKAIFSSPTIFVLHLFLTLYVRMMEQDLLDKLIGDSGNHDTSYSKSRML